MQDVKLRKIGNSIGTNFKSESLAIAGFAEGDRLNVHAEDGKILLTKADDTFGKCMEAYGVCKQRYARTLAELAK